jgi:hypothetical protein
MGERKLVFLLGVAGAVTGAVTGAVFLTEKAKISETLDSLIERLL